MQPANENAVKHGVRALAGSGRVPLKIKGGQHLRTVLRAMRRQLASEVERVTGRAPSLYQTATIETATRHEARARLGERWLAEHATEMSQSDRIAWLKLIGDASDSRDRCLKLLGLDAINVVHGVWDAWEAVSKEPTK